MSFKSVQVIASSNKTRVLFAAHEHDVRIVDLANGTHSEIIQTTFDTGGVRLVLSDAIDGLLAAAYHVHGLALYSCSTGEEVWRRKDIKKIQKVSLSRDGQTAFCGREGASLAVVELKTGAVIDTMRGVRSLRQSPFDDVSFVDSTKPHLLGGRRHPIEKLTFAFLSVSFGPGLLVLSEAGGAVRCFNVSNGTERWRYEPPEGSHVLHVAYRESPVCVLAIERPYIHGGAKRMLQIAVDNGQVLNAKNIGEPIDTCFVLSGSAIVTTNGELVDTVSGSTEKVLE